MSAPITITTGHNAAGFSTFIDNPEYKVLSPNVGIIYHTNSGYPIDTNQNADILAYENDPDSKRIPTNGSMVVVVEWPPYSYSSGRGLRSLSVDVGVMVQGEIICLLDAGESRTIRQGDVLIQRGTLHAWRNPDETVPARMICFVQPSQPVRGANEEPWEPYPD